MAAAESGPKSAKSGQEKTAKTGQEKGTKAGKQSSGKDAAAATAGAATEGGVASWADRLRDFQIEIPASATYDGLASDSSRGGAADRTDGDVGAEAAQKGGNQQEDDPSAWDGIGVDAATVIRHRRQFDLRCRAYEVRWNVFLKCRGDSWPGGFVLRAVFPCPSVSLRFCLFPRAQEQTITSVHSKKTRIPRKNLAFFYC